MKAASRIMLVSDNHEGLGRWRFFWYPVVVVLAVAGLTCSLATRTFRLTDCTGPTVQSVASQGMRQHLNRDAARWNPPVSVAITLETPPTFYPRVAPAGPPLPGLVLDEPLYNRPPPSRG